MKATVHVELSTREAEMLKTIMFYIEEGDSWGSDAVAFADKLYTLLDRLGIKAQGE